MILKFGDLKEEEETAKYMEYVHYCFKTVNC
jgi:hypothetical protein